MSPEGSFWAHHEWWAHRGDAEVSLAQLVLEFANRADRGSSHPRQFASELQAWTRLLAQTPWLRDELGSNAAMLATQGVRNPYRNSAAWDEISRLFGNYGAPLARYSLSFFNDAHERRPATRGKHPSQVRERARSVARNVRNALIDESAPGGSVLASSHSLQEFLNDTESARARHRAVAIRAYAEGLLRYALDVPDDAELREAIDGAVDKMAAEFGFTRAELEDSIRRRRPSHRAEAKEIVFDVALRKAYAQYDEFEHFDFYGKLLERSINKVDQQLSTGVAVPDADFIWDQTSRDLTNEYWRGQADRKVRVDPVSDEDLHLAAADPRRSPEDSYRRAQEHIEQAQLLQDAHKYLQNVKIDARVHLDLTPTTVTDFWEKTVAMAIVAGETPLGLLERSTVRKVVIDKWREQPPRPHDAVCTNRTQAAQLVAGLLHLAVASAVPDIVDFPDWVGCESPDQLWSQRLNAVDAVLQAHREHTPQDLYDDLHPDGELT